MQRHADATVVTVRAVAVGNLLTLTVRDNGCGFEAAAVGADGFGLASMRERSGLIGGALTVESHPGDGTSIRVEVPIVS